MKVKVKCPINYSSRKLSDGHVQFVNTRWDLANGMIRDRAERWRDDLLLWCWERDVDADFYKFKVDNDGSLYAVLSVDKADTFMLFLGQHSEWNRIKSGPVV